MRLAALVTFAAGVVAALSLAQLAPGQAVERVHIERASPRLPNGLYLLLASGDEYTRAGRGSWIGPAYWLPENPAIRNSTAINWEVGYDARPFSSERIALANLTRDWTEDQRAGVSVPHVVGRRVVGTIDGYFILQVERRSAPAELVLAFRVAPQLHTWVRFILPRPENDTFYVKGSVLASSWNRGQALLAMSRVRLEGNLPPSLVSIRPRRKGVLAGFVLDMHRHAVAGTRVALERRRGSRWRRIATSRTANNGRYEFRVKPASYRVTAILDGRFSATSRALRMRR